MYNFRDVTPGQTTENRNRSAESLSLGGVWLEDVITGFRILNVQGREIASHNVNTYAVGNVIHFQDRTKKPKNIKVTYQLIADDDEAFREKFNALNRALSGVEKEIVFADEPDKYFIGTVEKGADVPAGRNSIVSSFTIVCVDPVKYSKTLKSFAAENDVITINNQGTESVPIDYRVDFVTDCGFIGFAGQNGALQYGLDDEVDGEEAIKSVKLFKGPTSRLANELTYSPTNQGSTRVRASSAYRTTPAMSLINYGTGDNWHGGIKGHTFNECKSVLMYQKIIFHANATNRTGELYMQLRNADGKEIASIKFYKSKQNIHWYSVRLSILNAAGDKVWEVYKEFDSATQYNPYKEAAVCQIQKIEGQFKFYLAGEYYTADLTGIDWDSSTKYENLKAAQCVYGLYQYKTYDVIDTMQIDYVLIRKENVHYFVDLPNRYTEGDVMVVNGNEGKMYVNGAPAQGDEIAGSIHFLAPPGISTVNVIKSNWANVNVVASIREAWQ